MLSMLEDAWATVKAGGLPAWQAIFPRMLPASYAETSWAALTARGVQFRSAFSQPMEEPQAAAVVSVSLVPEEEQREFFGHAHGQIDVLDPEPDNDRWSGLTQATLHVYIYATPKELVRALHTFVLAATYSNELWLGQVGFEQLQYKGATDLAPHPDLMPKGVDIYGRVVRWSFSAMSDVGRISGAADVTPRWVTVAREGVQVDKYVDPSTGASHDLSEIVIGNVRVTDDLDD